MAGLRYRYMKFTAFSYGIRSVIMMLIIWGSSKPPPPA